jgi:ketosteroid isomerase-like protein
VDERAIQELIDRQAVMETIYRYASSIDQKDYPTLRSTFTDDAVAQYHTAPPIHGADQIVAWIDEMGGDRAFQHHLINVYHVELDGDEARTLTYHTSHQTSEGAPDTVYLIVGRYRDVLRRVDGVWKIADKRMEVGWMEERQHSQSAMNEKEAAESLAARDRGGEE